MSTLTFDEVESCFPETELIVIDGFGKDIVSAQWLHDFAHKVEQLVLAKADHEFKNFHRALCERFNYAHDPIDWKRDQVSLIEHIAKSNNDMIEGQRDVITDLENRLERLQEELATALTDKFDHHAEARQSALAAHGLTESDLQSPAPVSEAPSQPLTRTVEQLIEATEKSANFIPEFSGFEVRSLIGNMKGLQAQLDRSQHTLSAPPHSEQQEPDELHDIGCECGWT